MQAGIAYNLLSSVLYDTTGPAHFLACAEHSDCERGGIFVRRLENLYCWLGSRLEVVSSWNHLELVWVLRRRCAGEREISIPYYNERGRVSREEDRPKTGSAPAAE